MYPRYSYYLFLLKANSFGLSCSFLGYILLVFLSYPRHFKMVSCWTGLGAVFFALAHRIRPWTVLTCLGISLPPTQIWCVYQCSSVCTHSHQLAWQPAHFNKVCGHFQQGSLPVQPWLRWGLKKVTQHMGEELAPVASVAKRGASCSPPRNVTMEIFHHYTIFIILCIFLWG